MAISLLENIDEGFMALLSDLESLKSELYQTDWNNLYIQTTESRIDEIKSIIIEQQKNLEEIGEELLRNESNSIDVLYDDDDDFDAILDDIYDDNNDNDIYDQE
mgnify:CR=1 FL=1